MDTFALIMVLTAAILHASWNALVKSGGDPWFRMGVIMGAGSLWALLFTPFVAVPEAGIWPLLLLSAGVHQIYFCGLCLGYRIGDLSQIYPIQRGIAPVLVAIGAYLFMGERLSPQGIAGVALICLAILSLAAHSSTQPTNRTALLFALFTGTNIAIYSVVDGMAARLTTDIFSYIIWLFVISGIPFSILAVVRARRQGWPQIKRHISIGMLGSACASAAYGLVIWAMSLAPVTYVSALRETSVIAAALIGSRLMGEPFGGRRILAAGTVAIGVVVLHTSGAV